MKRLAVLLTFALSIASICGAQNLLPQPNKKGLWGYVNEKGKYAIKPVYQSADVFSSNLACVKFNGYYGYINGEGQFVIPAVYDEAESFKGNLAKCSKQGKYGLITTEGKEYLAFEYESLVPSENGRFYTGKKRQDGQIDVIELKALLPTVSSYDAIDDEVNGRMLVSLKGHFGYISGDGHQLIAPVFCEPLVFSDKGIAISKKDSGYGIVSREFKPIVPEQYAYVKKMPNGSYYFGNSESTFGIVSASGQILIAEGKYVSMVPIDGFKLYKATDSSAMQALVYEDGTILIDQCSFLTVNGNVASIVKGSKAEKINLNDGRRAIVMKGNEIWTPEKAQSIQYEDPYIVWKDSAGRQRRMTQEGKAVFDDYDNVVYLSKGRYCVRKDKRYAVSDANGKLLTEWADNMYGPLLDDYVILEQRTARGGVLKAFCRVSTGKMVSDYDFTEIYTPDEKGIIMVKLNTSNLPKERKLKLHGDSFFIVGELSEGMYPITEFKNKKMGVMTSEGTVLVSPKYDEVGAFRNGMCRVWIMEKGNGFIDKTGNLVIPCKYSEVMDFGAVDGVTNYAAVWDFYGNNYFIDKKGNRVSLEKVQREAYDNQRKNNW